MSLWTRTDGAAGKPKNLTAAEKSETFGVDATEIAVESGLITAISFDAKGSGYVAAPTVSFTSEAVTGIDSVADVDADTEIVTATAHPFSNGDKVKYSNGGGTSIGGLTTTNDYFIISALVNSFQLALTEGGVAIDLIDGIGVAHSFTGGAGAVATSSLINGKVSGFAVTNSGDGTYTDGALVVLTAPAAVVVDAAGVLGVTGIDSVADVDADTDIITATAHPFSNGDKVKYSNGGGTDIGGLIDASDFFVITALTNSFQLALTSNGVPIDLVDGVGVAHTFTGSVLTEAAHPFETGDKVLLTDGTGSLDGSLLTATNFWVIVLSASTISFATSKANADRGTAIVLTGDGSGADHTLTGETATAKPVFHTGIDGVGHTGWVKRTVGQGGRAGRVSYEVLVAGSITGDDADDVVFPDA